MYTHAVHNATEYTGMTGLQAGRLQPFLRSVERTCPEWERPHRAKGAIGFSLSSRAIPPRCRMSRHKVRSLSSFTLPTVGQQWDSKRCVTTGQLFHSGRCPRYCPSACASPSPAASCPLRGLGSVHACDEGTEVRCTPERYHSVHFRLARDRNRYAPPKLALRQNARDLKPAA